MSEAYAIKTAAANLAALVALTSLDLGSREAFGHADASRGRFAPREPSGKDRSKVKAARAQRVRQK